ncbi:MAG: peptide chain release factor N(5)-glutamine methyltransferase [Acidobacteria bacterium]|nr:peptide chain release factor N(5)-glutamine methyltransferase [Acidobacteriota bacterium]
MNQEDYARPGTVRAALIWGERELGAAGDRHSRLTAEILLGHALGWDRIRVLSSPSEALSPDQQDRFLSAVRRRRAGEPLQYIIGRREFYGRSFRVTPDVLIPRPETERLVERAVELAEACLGGKTCFVDVGTGSGCIAVSFACQVGGAWGYGTDSNPAALAVARANLVQHQVASRIGLVCGDLLEPFRPQPVFDLALCNLPYIGMKEMGTLPREVVDFEPRQAVFAGPSGTEAYARLFPQAAACLRRGGYLLFEMDPPQAEELRQRATCAGFEVVEILSDVRRLPRCIVARRSHG